MQTSPLRWVTREVIGEGGRAYQMSWEGGEARTVYHIHAIHSIFACFVKPLFGWMRLQEGIIIFYGDCCPVCWLSDTQMCLLYTARNPWTSWDTVWLGMAGVGSTMRNRLSPFTILGHHDQCRNAFPLGTRRLSSITMAAEDTRDVRALHSSSVYRVVDCLRFSNRLSLFSSPSSQRRCSVSWERIVIQTYFRTPLFGEGTQ